MVLALNRFSNNARQEFLQVRSRFGCPANRVSSPTLGEEKRVRFDTPAVENEGDNIMTIKGF